MFWIHLSENFKFILDLLCSINCYVMYVTKFSAVAGLSLVLISFFEAITYFVLFIINHTLKSVKLFKLKGLHETQ